MDHFNLTLPAAENVLRVIRAPSKSKLEIMSGITKEGDVRTFKTQIQAQDSLIHERIYHGKTTQIRIRVLSNPPPHINLGNYTAVSTLEISCPVDFSWIFSLVSALPSVDLVRFGSSAFETFLSENRFCGSMKECPSLKELNIRTDQSKFFKKDSQSCSIYLVKLVEAVNQILEFAMKYFRNLIRADLHLPINTNLDQFLKGMPRLKSNCKKENKSFDQGLVYFTTNDKSVPSRQNSVDGGPCELKSNAKSNSKLVKDPRTSYKSPSQSPVLAASVEQDFVRRKDLKRTHSSCSSELQVLQDHHHHHGHHSHPVKVKVKPKPKWNNCSPPPAPRLSVIQPVPAIPVPIPSTIPGGNRNDDNESHFSSLSSSSLPSRNGQPLDSFDGLYEGIQTRLRKRSVSYSSISSLDDSDTLLGSTSPSPVKTGSSSKDLTSKGKGQPVRASDIGANSRVNSSNISTKNDDFNSQFTRPKRRSM